jgi:hypothetical protein
MPKKPRPSSIVPIEAVQRRIYIVRGQRIILSSDLAQIYGVSAKQLNQAVGRNPDRFPEDFVFQLTKDEVATLSRSQFVTLNDRPARQTRGSNLKYLPYAFTEHGVLMAANLLRSPQAVKASLFVVRAFVKLRELLSTHHELAAKLDELEHRLQNHDDQILALVDAIRQLMEEPEDPPKPRIGFATELDSGAKPQHKAGGGKAILRNDRTRTRQH